MKRRGWDMKEKTEMETLEEAKKKYWTPEMIAEQEKRKKGSA